MNNSRKKLIYVIMGVFTLIIIVLGLVFGQSTEKVIDEPVKEKRNFLDVPTYNEQEQPITSEKIVYIDRETNESATTYWYYLFETMDGRTGFGIFESNEQYFPMDDVYNDVRNTLETKYPGKKYDFLMFTNTEQVSKKSYDNLPDWH